MRHNFSALSPIDFERLCADLLGAELGERFELFSAGADGGIDIRCHSKNLGLLIGQAKHYSDRNNLRQAVKKEIPKVESLKPNRYFLLTSCPLNPATKDEFVQWLSPYCHNSGDIWGEDELNACLARHPEVLRRHIKLWLQDESQLQAVLHNHLHQLSNQRRAELEDELLHFAFHPQVEQLLGHLEQHNILLITGDAGTGKSTTCGYLGLQLATQGYELHILSDTASIQGAWTLLQVEKKQCFVLDDFLGATFLSLQDALELERSLLSLLNKAKNSSGQLKLLIASRDYVLNQASERLPNLANWLQQNTSKFAVQISYAVIPDSAKADILYNLIHFSPLENSHRQELIENRNYWQIIWHQHFNPRLIKGLLHQVQSNDSQLLMPELIKGLDSPALYWENTFQRLSDEAQCLLYALALTSIQQSIAEEELRNAFAALYLELHGCYSPAMGLQAAISELEPNLILSREESQILWFSFANPSVQDMVQGFLAQHPGIQDAVINSMKYFSQGEYLLSFQRLKLNSRQLAAALQRMQILIDTGQTYINEWDGKLIQPEPVRQVTRLWQLYQKNVQQLSPADKKQFLATFTQHAEQANWEQWLKKGSIKHLLEIADMCLPEEQLPAVLDLALENIYHSQDGVELLEAYTENSKINKYLQSSLHPLIKSIEEACFDEASRTDDPDHLNQILSDMEAITFLAENNSKLSSELDLTDTKYLAWQKLDDVYASDNEQLTQNVSETQDVELLSQKIQTYQVQVEYVNSLFKSLEV